MQKDDTVVYEFKHVDNCGIIDSEYPLHSEHTAMHVFDSSTTWHAVLNQFVHFLEGIYGYNISDQVHYETLEDKLERLRSRLDDEEESDEDTSSTT